MTLVGSGAFTYKVQQDWLMVVLGSRLVELGESAQAHRFERLAV